VPTRNDVTMTADDTDVGSGTATQPATDVTAEAAQDVYTHGHQDAVLRSHRWRTAENSAAYLLPHISPGMTLLDVGCGPGTLTADLAAQVAPGRVLAVDTSTEVVEEARAHAEDRGVDNLDVVAGDFRDLDIRHGGFDVVHAHQVLQHLREPVGALRDMARLARPGGLVAVRDSDYGAMVWAPASEGIDRWREVYTAVTERNGADADAGRHLLGWAQAAGLREIVYGTSTWTFATPDDRSWWAELWADRIVSSALADQALEYGVASVDELADIAEAWRAWAIQPDGLFVVVHGEIVGHSRALIV
jgi:2-polyprenyl-3-methyl-5-hydroxy-6-metoxy-1,4-benzoquinol methylase